MNVIYRIFDENGKSYIGVTSNLNKRIKDHFSGNGSKLIAENLDKKFQYEILLESEEDLYNKEQFFIDKYNSLSPNGYNINKGGFGGSTSCRAGENNTQARLTESLVLEIRYAYSEGMTQEILASKYNVSRENISSIVRGNSWKSVGGPIINKHYSKVKTSQEIIDKIINLRMSTKLTYTQIASKLNISRSVAAKYGNGVR